MTNLDSVSKSKGISLPTKVCIVKAMVFPVVMYGCESWTIEMAEHWRVDVFKLWCWRRLLRVPWTERRANQSNLKEISPEYSLQGLILKLKLQYFGQLIWRGNSEKTLMLGKLEGRRRRERQRVRWMDGIMNLMDMNLGKLRETVRNREAWHDAAVRRAMKSLTQFGDWTTATNIFEMGINRGKIRQKGKKERKNCVKIKTYTVLSHLCIYDKRVQIFVYICK